MMISDDDRADALIRGLNQREGGPLPAGDVVLVRPPAVPALRGTFTGRTVHWLTPNRREWEALTAINVSPTEAWPSSAPGVVVVFLTKHKDENLGALAQALSGLAPGGLLVTVGANLLGAASYERELSRAGFDVETYSKHKCRVAFVPRPEALPEVLQVWTELATPMAVPGTSLTAQAGLFSAEHIDPGSALLGKHLPALGGRVGDWGAGWGYLASVVLERCVDLKELHLVDADVRGLRLATAALGAAATAKGTVLTTHWRDATHAVGVRGLDTIVSNPPFHDAEQHAVSTGLALMDTAAAALRPAGHLWVVTRRALPFEAHLATKFERVRQRAAADGYVIYEADHPFQRAAVLARAGVAEPEATATAPAGRRRPPRR